MVFFLESVEDIGFWGKHEFYRWISNSMDISKKWIYTLSCGVVVLVADSKKQRNKLLQIFVASLGVIVVLFAVYVIITKAKLGAVGYAWLFAGVVLLGLSFTSFFFIPFGVGCLLSAFAKLVDLNVLAQLFVFIGTSMIVWIVIHNLTNTSSSKPISGGLNGEDIIGSKALVAVEIDPPKKGRVYLLGNTWSAISEKRIEEGREVVVLSIEGVTVSVEEVEK